MNQVETLFKLKKPCRDCPFLKEGAIHLSPGRLEGIIQGLLDNDHQVFFCHATAYGDWTGEDGYLHTGEEAYCLGSMVYLDKCGRPHVPMRLGLSFGLLEIATLERNGARIIDPPE